MKVSSPKRILEPLVKMTHDPWQVMRLSIRISALCILISLLLTPGIWHQENRLLMPSPLFAWTAGIPRGMNDVLYAVLFLGSTLLFFLPEQRRIGFILVPVYAFLVMQDQIRWQFYLYMHFFNLLVAAITPEKVEDRHLDPLRYMVIGVYLWAGVYKMNLYFINTAFPTFVSSWFPYPALAKIIGAIVPFFEAGIGVLLFIPRTRLIGQLMAAAMLVVVLLSLGPFGRNIWLNVWPVNVYLDSLAIFLFMGRERSLWNADAFKQAMAATGIVLFILLPLLGMGNYLGHHQSFKLFCCPYRAGIVNAKGKFVSRDDLKPLPPGMTANLNLSTYPVLQPEYLSGFRGMCPYLHNPGAARLKVIEDAYPFWSDEAEVSLYDICAEKPKLLSRQKIKQ